MKINKSMQC